MRKRWIIGLVAMAWAATAFTQDACQKLVSLELPDTLILSAESIPAGPVKIAFPIPGAPAAFVPLPAHCRVKGSIRPTVDSDIRFEVWLPAQDWNHRYQQVGNGGLAGVMPEFQMFGPLTRGAAVAMTDNGHVSKDAFEGGWAKGHPEKLIDYGYRAVHLTAGVGRAVTAAYYGEQAAHSYFIGCSDGGRESLMEAQRYPLDFDGYLVGAPGIDIPRNQLTHVHVARQLTALGRARALTPALLQTLSQGVLEKCDAIDGVKDGVLRDPRQCRFDARELVCKAGSASGCLSRAQADAIQAMHAGPRDAKTGRQLAPGTWGTLGAESSNWPNVLLAPPGAPSLIDLANKGIIGELLYGIPDLDFAMLDLAKAEADIARELAPVINSDNPDLRLARQNGRRILHFHGWADPNISPQYSLEYFAAVQRKLGGDIGDFYRMFMVPGMAHCVGGVGPIGVNLAGRSGMDPERDWVSALERWVEQGIAPERIVAAELPAARGPSNPAGNSQRTRPVCPYPKVAVHDGKGSLDSAASFQCRVPEPAR